MIKNALYLLGVLVRSSTPKADEPFWCGPRSPKFPKQSKEINCGGIK